MARGGKLGGGGAPGQVIWGVRQRDHSGGGGTAIAHTSAELSLALLPLIIQLSSNFYAAHCFHDGSSPTGHVEGAVRLVLPSFCPTSRALRHLTQALNPGCAMQTWHAKRVVLTLCCAMQTFADLSQACDFTE